MLDVGGGIENYLNNILTKLSANHPILVLAQRYKKMNVAFSFDVQMPPFRSLAVFMIWVQLKKNKLFEECDLIISGSALTSPFIGKAQKPIMCFVYGLDLEYPNPFYQSIFVSSLKKMDGLIACSNATRELCLRKGIQKEKVYVVYPGVDSERFKPDKKAGELRKEMLGISQEDPVVFSISRHVKKKGILRLVRDIAPRLLEQVPHVKFVIGGSGPQTNDIKKIVKSLGLEKIVILTGYITDVDMASYYNMADVFCLPEEPVVGDFEGFGMVHLEASACGVPSVGSRMEAATEAIEDGVRGVACDPFDIRQHVDAIRRFIVEKEYQNEFSLRCRSVILERWTINKTTATINEIVERVSGSN